jgi:hypothetical protein
MNWGFSGRAKYQSYGGTGWYKDSLPRCVPGYLGLFLPRYIYDYMFIYIYIYIYIYIHVYINLDSIHISQCKEYLEYPNNHEGQNSSMSHTQHREVLAKYDIQVP